MDKIKSARCHAGILSRYHASRPTWSPGRIQPERKKQARVSQFRRSFQKLSSVKGGRPIASHESAAGGGGGHRGDGLREKGGDPFWNNRTPAAPGGLTRWRGGEPAAGARARADFARMPYRSTVAVLTRCFALTRCFEAWTRGGEWLTADSNASELQKGDGKGTDKIIRTREPCCRSELTRCGYRF